MSLNVKGFYKCKVCEVKKFGYPHFVIDANTQLNITHCVI